MKVLLIQPAWKPKRSALLPLPSITAPIQLECVAGAIPEHEAIILDLRLEPDDAVQKTLETFRPDVVASTGVTVDTYFIIDTMKQVKEWNPKTLTVVGGQHASLSPESFDDPAVDVVVIGEGEFTFRELLEAHAANADLGKVKGLAYRQNGGQVFTETRPVTMDTNRLPLPNRELTRKYWDDYYYFFGKPAAVMETSRGCPYECTFCPSPLFFQGKYRTFDPERVADELATIEADYVLVVDDNFLQDVKRSHQLADLLQARGIQKTLSIQARSDTMAKNPDLVEKWRATGAVEVFVGFEAATDEGLSDLNKRNVVENNRRAVRVLNDCGMASLGSFIIGPDFEKADFEYLAQHVDELGATLPMFTMLTPFPGTTVSQNLRGSITNRDYEFYDLFHMTLRSKLPRDEFYSQFAKLSRHAFLDSKSANQLDPNALTEEIVATVKALVDPASFVYGEEKALA